MSDLPADTQPDQPDVDAAQALVRRITIIAGCSILLGFAIQGLILAVKLWGGAFPAATTVITDLTQGVTWSLIICIGVGIITSLSKAKPVLAGALSFLAAPLAVAVAKAGQATVAGLISAAEQQAILSLGTISALRAVEYGLLGWALTRLVQRNEARASPYFGAGGLVGLVFGGAIVWITFSVATAASATPGLAQMISTAINEILFPLGCAGVIYAGQAVTRSTQIVAKAKAGPATLS